MSIPILRRNPAQVAVHTLWTVHVWLSVVLLGLAFGALAQTSPSAGKVMFVTGTATRQVAQTPPLPITRDTEVLQGDQLATAADGYLYVRMADGALLVLRPGSTLRIDQWQYNAERPDQSQIKYTLQQGVSRYVSGKGSQAAKERFRYNTPMAAIGVRGTDFTVLARTDLTQVAVRSGGVVVSPFDVSCSREALGPCEGRSAAELFAAAGASFLQLRAGEQRPQIIRPNASPGPDQTAPALGNEPTARSNSSSPGNSVEIVSNQELRSERLASTLNNLANQPKSPLAIWGRWGQLSADEAAAYIHQLLQDRQLVAISSDFVLARNAGMVTPLPESGIGRFRMTEHDGLYRDTSSAPGQTTTASAGSLNIDFAQRKYQTELQLDMQGQALKLQSTGTVDPGNILQSSVLDPATSLKGVVGGPGAAQAAYLYRSKLPNGAEISGTTAWGR